MTTKAKTTAKPQAGVPSAGGIAGAAKTALASTVGSVDAPLDLSTATATNVTTGPGTPGAWHADGRPYTWKEYADLGNMVPPEIATGFVMSGYWSKAQAQQNADRIAEITANPPTVPGAGTALAPGGSITPGGAAGGTYGGASQGGGVPIPGGGVGAGGTQQQRDALTYLKNVLGQYGLGGDDTVTWAWSLIVSGAGNDEILQQLRVRPEYKTRFAGMEDLAKKGRAITEAQYIDLERQYNQINRMHALTPGAYDTPETFAKLIAGEVSPTEWNDRLTSYDRTVSDQVSPDVQSWAQQHLGLSKGDLKTIWMNPDVALTQLQKNEQMAQIGGAAGRSGIGDLSTDRAARLAALGVTGEQATAGFAKVYDNRELMQDLPGVDAGGSVSEDDLIGATLGGDAAAAERATRLAATRRAAFQGGGGFASTQSGAAGLGSATT